MKLLKTMLLELIVILLLFLLMLLVTQLTLHFVFGGRSRLDIMVAREMVEFNLIRLTLLSFVPLVCLVYSIRFIFFKPRKLFVGFVAVCYIAVLHLMIIAYSPLYIQYRKLTTEPESVKEYQTYNDQGYPEFNDEYTAKMNESYDEWNASIKRELYWIQIPLVGILLGMLLLLLIEISKKNRGNQIQSAQ